MTDLNSRHWALLAALSDGLPQHVSQLARVVGMKPQQLNGFWQQMPSHIRGLLRQHDGQWRLVRPLAVFAEESLQQMAGKQGFRAQLKHECSSSNDEIMALARQSADLAHKALCVAHFQTKGRGRQGRSWVNRQGECLMFSLGWTFDKPQYELGSLALVVALACRRALADIGLDVKIKWPNDLVVANDKLAGILIETARVENKTVAVIGIGINFVLPKEVENATSVQALFQAASKQGVSVKTLLNAVLAQLDALLNEYAQKRIRVMCRRITMPPTATRADQYCCFRKDVLSTKAWSKAWMCKARCVCRRTKAKKPSSAARSVCARITARHNLPLRNQNAFCCWTAATVS